MKNIWPVLVILHLKSIFLFITRGIQLDNGVEPPVPHHQYVYEYDEWSMTNGNTHVVYLANRVLDQYIDMYVMYLASKFYLIGYGY